MFYPSKDRFHIPRYRILFLGLVIFRKVVFLFYRIRLQKLGEHGLSGCAVNVRKNNLADVSFQSPLDDFRSVVVEFFGIDMGVSIYKHMYNINFVAFSKLQR